MPYDIIIGRNKEDKKKFGDKGLIYLGKGYVQMKNYISLSNKIWLDVARSHVILVAGKRGCLPGETNVFTNNGYKPIKEFDAKEDKILSFNKEKKEFEWETAELLKYNISKENLLEIELEDGRKLQLTKEHPLLMNYGKYLFWRLAQELKIKDKIILTLKLPEITKDNETLRIARSLGFVLSDGTINKRKGRWKDGRGKWYDGIKSRLRIFCDDENVLRQAKEDLEKEFGLHVKEYKRNDCNCSVVQSLHAKVIDKINNLGVPLGNKSAIIRVPKIVWKSSNEFKANFISALFSCDGYINKTGRYIDYSSKSKKFLEDLQILLTHFNIESVIRVKNAKCKGKVYLNHRLFITDNSSVENFKKIGFISKFKQQRLDKHKFNKTKRRKTLYISDNLVCTKIKNIKEIEGINEVYDLSVNKNHSFIANGIISHNSGKSYSLGVICEELSDLPEEVRKNIAPLIFDTMGIFWTMKYKNEKDSDLLEEWELKPKNLPVNVWVPTGYFNEYEKRGIPVDKKFALAASELDIEDWLSIFELKMTEPVSILVQNTISNLKNTSLTFDIEEIIELMKKDTRAEEETKKAATALFEAADSWKVFAKKNEPATKINDLICAGKTSVLDLSIYSSTLAFNVRALIIGLISKKLFNQRTLARKKEEIESIRHGLDSSYEEEKEMPLVWLFLDEAHEFLPMNEKTPATNALIQLLREGRQPGISMVLATQQPGVIHRDVMTQSDIVLSHRLTNKKDIEALNEIMQSYFLETVNKSMKNLPDLRGSALLLDDNSERLYPIRIRPRFTWHGGEAPKAVSENEKE
ncbi:MAG: LAGLIDADG family homing endonuclease [Candidatus Pacearchaeota archaeon]